MRHALASVAVVVVSVNVACSNSDKTGGGATIGNEPSTNLPAINVDLPPPPAFEKPTTPEKYPDQALSVYGLRRKLADHLDQEVRVRGYLVETYACPCKGGKTTDTCTCELPHFLLGDEPTTPKEKTLLVADMPFNDLGKKLDLKMETGKQYIVAGMFARQSNTGFASSEGVLIYRAHGPGDGSAPVAPPTTTK